MNEIKQVQKVGSNYPEYLYFWLNDDPLVDQVNGFFWAMASAIFFINEEVAKSKAPQFGKYSLYKIRNPFPEDTYLHLVKKINEHKEGEQKP